MEIDGTFMYIDVDFHEWMNNEFECDFITDIGRYVTSALSCIDLRQYTYSKCLSKSSSTSIICKNFHSNHSNLSHLIKHYFSLLKGIRDQYIETYAKHL